jgi:hypothetical protein
VPEGLWQVKAELSGYTTTDSGEWLPVPPPQTEVNIGMVSTDAPTVQSVSAYPEGLEITFSKYMKISSLNEAITVSENGSSVSGAIQAKNDEDGLATIFRFAPNAEITASSVTVGVSTAAESYAGTKLAAAYSSPANVALEPKAISADDATVAYYSTGKNISVTITPAEAAAGRTITAISSDGNIATVSANAVVGSNGVATIRVTPVLPGAITVTLSLSGSTLVAEVEVKVDLDAIIDIDVLIGDVNDDDSVDGKDVTYLARYLAEWSGYSVILDAADCNKDGSVDGKDVTYLARYLAEWAGYAL